jgi:hypothetical protein
MFSRHLPSQQRNGNWFGFALWMRELAMILMKQPVNRAIERHGKSGTKWEFWDCRGTGARRAFLQNWTFPPTIAGAFFSCGR